MGKGELPEARDVTPARPANSALAAAAAHLSCHHVRMHRQQTRGPKCSHYWQQPPGLAAPGAVPVRSAPFDPFMFVVNCLLAEEAIDFSEDVLEGKSHITGLLSLRQSTLIAIGLQR